MNILGNMALNALPQGLALLKNALSKSQQPTIPTQTVQQSTAPTTPTVDTSSMIKDQYTQALAARTAAINKARDTAINGFTQQIAGADGQYQPLRNDASYQGSKSLQGLKETMASQGLFNSGDNVTGQLNVNNSTAKNINSLNSQQQDYINQLNNAITQAKANGEYDIANANADILSQQAGALVNQANTDRTYNYQVDRDKVTDTGYTADGKQTLSGKLAISQITGQNLSNDAQVVANKYADQIAQGQINMSKAQLAYQTLVNKGYTQSQALDNALKSAQITNVKANTSNTIKSTSLLGLKTSGSGGGSSSSKSRSSSSKSSGSSSNSSGGMTAAEAKRQVENQLNKAIKNHTGKDYILNNKSILIKEFGQSYYNSLVNKYVPYNTSEGKYNHAVTYNMRPR